MASVALFGCDRVRGGFVSSCTDTVVASSTVTRLPGNGAMIKEYLQPAGSIVADLARFRRRDVCRTFACSDSAIVAVLANIRGLAVIQRYHKGIPAWAGGVAGFADICGDWMRGRFVSGIRTGMTGGASVRGLGMIEWQYEGDPTGSCGMT